MSYGRKPHPAFLKWEAAMRRLSFTPFTLFITFALCVFVVLSLAGPLPTAHATISYTTTPGSIDPPNPIAWISSTYCSIGNTVDGNIEVDNGDDLSSSFSVIGNNSNVTGKVIIDGPGSAWTNGEFHVGGHGYGILEITNGGSVSSGVSGVGGNGNFIGGTGLVTIKGVQSLWTNYRLQVGYSGDGILNLIEGGHAVSTNCQIGGFRGPIGIVTVNGDDSMLSASSRLSVGAIWPSGSGTLNVTNGGSVTCGDSSVGNDAGGKGFVSIDGTGSRWTNNGQLLLGMGGPGTFRIFNGAAVTATSLSVNYLGSVLAIDIGNDSSLVVGNGSGTIADTFGTIRMLAGARPAANSIFTPILAGTWTTGAHGVYQAIGGTWDTVNHRFTVSEVLTGASGDTFHLDLASVQRVLVGLPASTWSVGASFLAKTGSPPAPLLDFTATAMSGGPLTALELAAGSNHSVLGAWQFTASGGYTSGDPAYLSFAIAPGYDRDDLEVWHYDDSLSLWTKYDAADLTCNGTVGGQYYASFTVTGFSGYAVLVPEPGAMALLITGLLGGLAYAWRKRWNRNTDLC
jgi:T5SS/PEP-CTERM-associated repeat protein